MKQRVCLQEQEDYTDKRRFIVNSTSNLYRIYAQISLH